MAEMVLLCNSDNVDNGFFVMIEGEIYLIDTELKEQSLFAFTSKAILDKDETIIYDDDISEEAHETMHKFLQDFVNNLADMIKADTGQ